MKGKMKAKLVDCRNEQGQTIIEVINIKNPNGESYSLVLDGISHQKIAYVADLLNEENNIELNLSLEDNLQKVVNMEATVNGVDIDFTDIDNDFKDSAARKLKNQKNIENMKGDFKFLFFIIAIIAGIFTVILNW